MLRVGAAPGGMPQEICKFLIGTPTARAGLLETATVWCQIFSKVKRMRVGNCTKRPFRRQPEGGLVMLSAASLHFLTCLQETSRNAGDACRRSAWQARRLKEQLLMPIGSRKSAISPRRARHFQEHLLFW